MIDTHSHLFDDAFKEDLEACITRCINENVNKIVLVGFSHETNQKAFEIATKYNLFYPTAGLHPSEATKDYQKDLEDLEVFVQSHKVYAIGECGLDYHYGKENIVEQQLLFEGQINLAIKYNLPLIIHMRDATLDTFKILKKYQGKIRGVMHCYSGSYEMAKEFIKLGFMLSFGGPITFKNAKENKYIVENIDLKYILTETDCPYLAPMPYRGKRNESSYVKNVLIEIARLKQMSFEEVEKITEANAIKLFNLEV